MWEIAGMPLGNGPGIAARRLPKRDAESKLGNLPPPSCVMACQGPHVFLFNFGRYMFAMRVLIVHTPFFLPVRRVVRNDPRRKRP